MPDTRRATAERATNCERAAWGVHGQVARRLPQAPVERRRSYHKSRCITAEPATTAQDGPTYSQARFVGVPRRPKSTASHAMFTPPPLLDGEAAPAAHGCRISGAILGWSEEEEIGRTSRPPPLMRSRSKASVPPHGKALRIAAIPPAGNVGSLCQVLRRAALNQ